MPDAEERVKSFPHELSGGMRQRVMIAMMLSRYPELLIADEPTTALDVTIEAQILEIMCELKEKYNTAIMLITHNFGLVAEIADRIGIMYAGEMVETGDVFEIFENPKHPYTKLLMQHCHARQKLKADYRQSADQCRVLQRRSRSADLRTDVPSRRIYVFRQARRLLW